MPKQLGTFPISGTMQNLTFYRTEEYGDLVKQKGGPTREQVLHGKNYENTRRNNTEFGRASKYGKYIRRAFHELLMHCKETKLDTNLSKRLREIIRMDNESAWGKRDLRRNTLAAFRHFELNSKSLSSKYFELPVDAVAANGYLEVPAGISFKSKMQDADAWKVISIAASIDLMKGKSTTDVQKSDLYELEKGSFGVGFNHTYDENKLLFHGMGIVFYEYDAVIDDYRELKKKQERVNVGFLRYVPLVPK